MCVYHPIHVVGILFYSFLSCWLGHRPYHPILSSREKIDFETLLEYHIYHGIAIHFGTFGKKAWQHSMTTKPRLGGFNYFLCSSPKLGKWSKFWLAHIFSNGWEVQPPPFRNHPLTFFSARKAGKDHLSLPELTAKLRSCGARADQADSIEELFEAWHIHTESWQRLEIFWMVEREIVFTLPATNIAPENGWLED